MFDALCTVTPSEGDLIIVKNGHFIMAISHDHNGVINVYDNQAAYLDMIGMDIGDIISQTQGLNCDDPHYAFYWMDA